jgi:V8-like Glu-specific endopeptidase
MGRVGSAAAGVAGAAGAMSVGWRARAVGAAWGSGAVRGSGTIGGSGTVGASRTVSESRASGLSRRGRTLAAAAVTAVTVAGGLVGMAGQAGAARSAAAPATQAAVHSVGASAQAATARFWTVARMKGATQVGATSTATASGQVTAGPQADPSPPPGTPDSVHFDGVPTVGALFFTTGTQAHFCTASVVDSATLDLLLTAAHCVYGSGGYATNVVYVPKWHQGVSPYGAWPVKTITVAAGWQQSQNPDLDFAFLAVTPPAGTHRPVQLVTGGLRLGINTAYSQAITPIGYNNTDNAPIKCATRSLKFEPTQIEFYCNNYQDGTSGGPWITHFNPKTGTGTVIGEIGGYEQGGDYAWQSFSPYYSWSILRLFAQAELRHL